jgi:chitin synthase
MVYLGLIALQVILGLGNRPKAERFAYTMSIWVFGLLALYLIVNTLYLTGMALCPLQHKLNAALDAGQTIWEVLLSGTFGPIVSPRPIRKAKYFRLMSSLQAAGLIGTFVSHRR